MNRLARNRMSESHLTEADVRRLLDPAQLIPAIALAFRDRYPSVIIPQRTQTQLAHGTFLSMSCYDPLSAALGMKLVVGSREDRRRSKS